MSEEGNKAVVRRFFEEVFNEGNLDLVDELVSPDTVNHAAPGASRGSGAPRGPEPVKQLVTMLRSAFPDLHITIEDMIAEGNKVVMRNICSGTHEGDFMGMPPTGRRFEQEQIHIIRFKGEKAAEHWAVRDDLAQMVQLGVVSLPGGEG